jgi:hypothetical protein
MLFSVPVLFLVALLTMGRGLRRRAVAAGAFALSALVLLSAYSAATYRQTKSSTGQGHFGLSYTDGFYLFAKYAQLTDCSEPGRSPAIRRAICETPHFTDRSVDGVLWYPGPVSKALYARDYVARNSDLRGLALEGIREDPLGAVRVVVDPLPHFLDEEHWSSHLAPATTGTTSVRAPSYLDRVLARDFAINPRTWSPDSFEQTWNRLYDAWRFVRLAAFAGWFAALVLVRRWWDRGGRAVLVVSAPLLAVLASTVLTGYPYPRYLLPIEGVAWLCTAWLVARLRDGAPLRDALTTNGDADVVASASPRSREFRSVGSLAFFGITSERNG